MSRPATHRANSNNGRQRHKGRGENPPESPKIVTHADALRGAHDADPAVRMRAAEILSGCPHKSRNSRRVLRELRNDPDEGVREAARRR